MANLRIARPEELHVAIEIDDEASTLFVEAGLDFAHLGPEHPYVVRERHSWAEAMDDGSAFFALDATGTPIAFLAMNAVDGHAHLEQLSVRRASMRRGIGRSLIEHAKQWAIARGHVELWLTTYDHFPWNRPYYERAGFSVMRETECGPEMRAILSEQREALPSPDRRVAMKRTSGAA